MEKIALIMNGGSRNMVISDKTLARLKTLGEVVINEGSAGKADVIRAITGATVAITSWGNTGIDGDILAACPDLKLVCHAAGSVKPIVTDELWKKGRARRFLRLPARTWRRRNGAGLYHLCFKKFL